MFSWSTIVQIDSESPGEQVKEWTLNVVMCSTSQTIAEVVCYRLQGCSILWYANDASGLYTLFQLAQLHSEAVNCGQGRIPQDKQASIQKM